MQESFQENKPYANVFAGIIYIKSTESVPYLKYAKVIIDISADAVDRAFTYYIPKELEESIFIGSRVSIGFGAGNKKREGIVIGITDTADFELSKIKPIEALLPKKTDANEELIELASFMAREYGCTLNQALITVLPVKKIMRKNSRRTNPLKIIEAMGEPKRECLSLTKPQQTAFEEIISDERTSLLYGITGSGKTRIYIELIRSMQKQHKASIVLIPEISLTYQTVRELANYLGDRVAVMHSKLSEGERFEQYMKAQRGEIDIMVGPRSAVFTPFSNLGLIIIDEEHERTYRSDTSPRYDTREVAIKRAHMCGAKVLLASATPSLESYKKALDGVYALHKLKVRAHDGACLPKIHVKDMRAELSEGNRSIFSSELKSLIEDRLNKKEQVMLFLNRRGYAGFVSCRSCGRVIKCPHCDVSLTAHNSWYQGKMQKGERAALLSCHYCGYTAPMPRLCPECKSKYIAPFGTGTEKLEQAVKKEFPKARVLRMDADTTAKKGSFERILSAFGSGKADILIGTQMIVKGHDFERVSLVGIVAADLSLNTPEYDASERTFQLLTQAAGRSGRGNISGDVVIQSYDPSHYAISCAAMQDYESFYEREISYRRILKYPPEEHMLFFRLSSSDEELLNKACSYASYILSHASLNEMTVIGPCSESIYKVNDSFRKIIYIKHKRHDIIKRIRDELIRLINEKFQQKKLYLNYDIR